MGKMKICSTCKRELPATPQYFYKFIHAKDGLKSSCKECQGGNFKVKEKLPEGYRRCNRCKQVLPETEDYFLKYWSKKDSKYYWKCHCLECGKKSCKAWRQDNPEKYKEYYTERNKTEEARTYNREYKRANRDKGIEQHKRYRSKPENLAKIKAYDAERRRNPETREKVLDWSRRWRAENPEKVADYNKQYLEGHKDYFRQATHIRNARKKALKSTLTLEEWEAIKAHFGYTCAYCGKSLERFQQDHFIPLSQGGEYTAKNIVPACKKCNCSKHTSSFEEWYRRQSFYTPERKAFILDYIERGL